MEGEKDPGGACRSRCRLIFRWSLLGAGVGEGDGGYIRPCPSIPSLEGGHNSPSSLGLEEKGGRALARCPFSLPLATLIPT